MTTDELSGKGLGLSIAGLARVARDIAAALLPQDCLLCAEAHAPGALCAPCLAALPRAVTDGCPQCALPTSGGALCGECLSQPPHFDTTVAALWYEFPVDRLIQALKYQHRLPVAGLLAELMLPGAPPGIDRLLPVPLSSARLALRGFNQAAEIARTLARALQRPLDIDGCRRSVDTAPQTGLPWQERRRNLRHAFECNSDYSGQHIVVIDDVMTTGATLDELALTLKRHGAARVTNWVGARTARRFQ